MDTRRFIKASMDTLIDLKRVLTKARDRVGDRWSACFDQTLSEINREIALRAGDV